MLTWDEPAASAGASRTVTYDLDLWVDQNADCTAANGACGEFASASGIDNVEYVVVNSPAPGVYRLKVTPFNAPSFALGPGAPAAAPAATIEREPSRPEPARAAP